MGAEIEHLCLLCSRGAVARGAQLCQRDMSSQTETQQSSHCSGAQMHEQMKGVTRNNGETLSVLNFHVSLSIPRGQHRVPWGAAARLATEQLPRTAEGAADGAGGVPRPLPRERG